LERFSVTLILDLSLDVFEEDATPYSIEMYSATWEAITELLLMHGESRHITGLQNWFRCIVIQSCGILSISNGMRCAEIQLKDIVGENIAGRDIWVSQGCTVLLN